MQPLERSEYFPLTQEHIEESVRVTAGTLTRAEVILALMREREKPVYVNNLYQVQVDEDPVGCEAKGWTHLNIRRRDGAVILRDWRHFQLIKNQLCGPEREAVELYPAESRLVDTSNKYHLWVAPLGYKFPFGWTQRGVADLQSDNPGMRQRA